MANTRENPYEFGEFHTREQTKDWIYRSGLCWGQIGRQFAEKLLQIFQDGQQRFGGREWSPNIIKRLEQACDVEILAPGFPAQMTDDEPGQLGYEIIPGPT